MDIPLPEESQPPGLPDGQVSSFSRCDNIPLPSCDMQLNTNALPPPFPPPALPIAAPVLPPEAPPPLETSEVNTEQADDPNRLVCEICWVLNFVQVAVFLNSVNLLQVFAKPCNC